MADVSKSLVETVTPEWLESKGFARHRMLGYTKRLAAGPAGSSLEILVGHFPHNQACVALLLDGFGVVTNAATPADIEALLRLLDGATIDHPCEM